MLVLHAGPEGYKSAAEQFFLAFVRSREVWSDILSARRCENRLGVLT